jgi:peptidoglycan/xylan/chitin deacetylase (PgdA/CDA1 family)
MCARRVSPGEARARVTRRAVLTIGGLTIAAGYLMDPARQAAQAARSPDTSRSATASSQPPEITAKAEVSRGSARRGADDSPMFYLDDGPKAIALTIDDGPNPVYTPQVLQLLAKYQVTATFSMIGTEVGAYPGVVRDVAAAGHVIANHTWTHIDLSHLKAAAVADQMNRTTDAIHTVTGKAPTLFRAPYGAWSSTILQECATTGMAPLDWSVDPRDWARPGVSSIVRNIMRNTRTGSIILEHDGGGNRSETVAALKIVLPRLLAAGYQFRTP